MIASLINSLAVAPSTVVRQVNGARNDARPVGKRDRGGQRREGQRGVLESDPSGVSRKLSSHEQIDVPFDVRRQADSQGDVLRPERRPAPGFAGAFLQRDDVRSRSKAFLADEMGRFSCPMSAVGSD
eukprot:CAMPEP_0172570740 /NCGR_PEP_ID=MMETSP1067-20121228/128678_1 /TAXON_ID=265564 ORGANISM="Thalassiosira punctigera, Strain Tpunct2005C2" /NCGR_SAMPLE_ID=MMETSP1067 /ASSEMBLY_ACC=CAM_ASM_000444 /LENGTH=126 /DNA_ID=CAMNT_0013362899 /DNA_START=375 /DNA_END=754 /DNA_ORIENTATION=+